MPPLPGRSNSNKDGRGGWGLDVAVIGMASTDRPFCGQWDYKHFEPQQKCPSFPQNPRN